MTCTDVERVLPELMDGAPDDSFQSAFDLHVKSCLACAELVSDLKLIANEARQLAESEEPAERVWVRIAAQLRSEGLIREPGSTSIPVASSGRRWRAWWLVPVAAAIVAAGSYIVNHKPAAQMAQQVAPPAQAPAAAPAQENSPESAAKTPTESTAIAAAPKQTAQTKSAAAAQTSIKTNAAATIAKTEVEPGPNQDDRQFLSMVSTRAPAQRAAYENQLQAVNADIRQVQEYLQRNPGDADARQQLMDAYQQKALLYQIALDRIQ